MEMLDAFIKQYDNRPGAKKTKITFVAPLTPKIADALGFRSLVFDKENTPKQQFEEVKLKVSGLEVPFTLKLNVPNIIHVLEIQCDEHKDWMARLKGSTKKGKSSRLLIQFKAVFTGTILPLVEWLEKYGQAAGTLTLAATTTPEQPTLTEQPKKSTGKEASAGIQ